MSSAMAEETAVDVNGTVAVDASGAVELLLAATVTELPVAVPAEVDPTLTDCRTTVLVVTAGVLATTWSATGLGEAEVAVDVDGAASAEVTVVE